MRFAVVLVLGLVVSVGGCSSEESNGDGSKNGGSGSIQNTSSSGGSSGGVDPKLGLCSGSDVEPAAATEIGSYIDKLPFDQPTGAARTEVIEAVLHSCHVFSPQTSPGWEKKYCWAHLVSAILKESSYNAALTELDAYGKRNVGGQQANDPTVGLLQIRFSATVRDYSVFGPADKMSCIGCDFPASFASHKNESSDSSFWAVTGPPQNMALMRKRSCNIALGAWYCYAHATSNGSATVTTYVDSYCTGGPATAGNLITGLRSHLEGPDVGRGVTGTQSALDALAKSDPGGYEYTSEIRGFFDGMIGSVSGKHPFFVLFAPNSAQYCR